MRPSKNRLQAYTDGVVSIYEVKNGTVDGNRPKEALTLKVGGLRYEERMVGLTRIETAKNNGARIKYVLRCPLLRGVSPLDIAVPNDGTQYRIRYVQFPPEYPTSMDLTLEEIQAQYAVAPPEEEDDESEPA